MATSSESLAVMSRLNSLQRLSWLRFGGDVIACLLQGFLQKFCIGRGNVILILSENKNNWGCSPVRVRSGLMDQMSYLGVLSS